MATKQTTKTDEARKQREEKAAQAEFDKQAETRAAKREAAKTEAAAKDKQTEAAASGKAKARTGKPTELSAPVKVDAPPEINRGNGGGGRARSERWVNQLAPCIAEPGAWFRVAEFNAASTAGTQSSLLRVAARQYAQGETPKVLLPEFDVEKYELQVLKRENAIYAALVERKTEKAEA